MRRREKSTVRWPESDPHAQGATFRVVGGSAGDTRGLRWVHHGREDGKPWKGSQRQGRAEITVPPLNDVLAGGVAAADLVLLWALLLIVGA